MPDPNAVLDHVDADHVEPVALGPSAVPVDPDPSRTAELTPLSPADRLDRFAEFQAFPRLDLDEGDDAMTLRHEVDVAVAGPEPPIHDLPAVPLQPSLGDPLAQKPELLPSV